MHARNILIVDRDLGFVFWLGQILDAAGYVAIPAKGIAEATEIVSLLRLQVDVLIASLGERGVTEFADRLRSDLPGLSVIDLHGDGELEPDRHSESGRRSAPRRDEEAKAYWLEAIRNAGSSLAASVSR